MNIDFSTCCADGAPLIPMTYRCFRCRFPHTALTEGCAHCQAIMTSRESVIERVELAKTMKAQGLTTLK